MCGIFGYRTLDASPIDPAALDAGTDSLAHRGPDGRGTFIDKAAGVGLGHRRLSILDLSDAGRQPMQYDDRYLITFNGEVYNFLELRWELIKLGHRFRSDSDTEVVLAAYAQWGEACQLRMNGMWAFAIWDKQERTLFLSRDRFGIKPLHYLKTTCMFAFASEMKAFLHLPSFEPRMDADIVTLAIQEPLCIERSEHCLLQGVKRLPAGHSLTVRRNGSHTVHRWWNTLDHLINVPECYEDQVTLFRDTFEDACAIRMRSDVPLGTALSGGLDSSSVLCMMKHVVEKGRTNRVHKNWQTAFVAAYRNSPYDETPFARQVIDYIGGTGVFKDVDTSTIFDEMDPLLYCLEDIYWDIPVGLWIIYKAMRENGIYVTLDGHGGDELLCGYHHHLVLAMSEALASIQPLRLASLYMTLRSMYPAGMRPTMPSLHYIRKKPKLPEYANTFEDFTTDMPKTGHMGHMERMLYFDTHYNALPAILRNFDRMSMAHGVEIRTPFLDWRLAVLAFSLPACAKLAKFKTKRILRNAMTDLMPESIRLRSTKIGFVHAKKKRFTPHWAYLEKAVSDPAFARTALFDGKELQQRFQKAFAADEWNEILWPEPYVQAVALERLFSRSFAKDSLKIVEDHHIQSAKESTVPAWE